MDSRIRVRGENECWPWTGGIFLKDGYGRLKFKGAEYSVPRLSYELKIGEIPTGLVVRHTCDNPICANYLSHLLLGTVKENATDAVERDRYAFGERCHSSKFTTEQVLEIRSLANSGVPKKLLAVQFDCSDVAIGKIVSGKSYRRVHENLCTL